MNTSYVNLSVKDQIGVIEFYSPEHNALPTALLQKLTAAVTKAGADRAVSVILLKSAGDRTFCAGASFKELKQITNEEEGKAFFSGFANLINALRTSPKFVVARAQGKAVGGGVGILAAADYCLATKYAAIKLSELSIGIGPFVIAPAIERKIGVAALSQLTLDCSNFYQPEWSLAKGLFAQVFEDTQSMDAAIAILLTRLASYNPDAIKAMKQVLWEGTSHWDALLLQRAEMSGKLVLSDFTKQFLSSL